MNPLGPVIIPQMREGNVIMGYCFFPSFHQRDGGGGGGTFGFLSLYI